MEINLEEKSKQLKEYVSKYETKRFLGDLSNLIHHIKSNNPIQSLQGLSSPLRQIFYVAALHLSSIPEPESQIIYQYSQDEWEEIKKLLNEVEEGYSQLFNHSKDEEITESWMHKRRVAMPSFFSFFNQGSLNFEEQTLERVIDYFTPFNQEIKNHFNLEINDFIEIYNFLNENSHQFINSVFKPKPGEMKWKDFVQEMKSRENGFEEMNDHLPEHYKNLFGYMADKGRMYRFTKTQLVKEFGENKAVAFLNALVTERKQTKFLYYTEPNILHSKPIFKIEEDEFQVFQNGQIINAIYNSLANFLIKNSNFREKFYAVRGVKLEDKIEKIFQKFFKNKAFVYRSFYSQDGNEQDLLFLHEGCAFIVEAKASKRDEPRREPEKAYPLILSNFNETIQKGYDQAYRVKSKFITNEPLKIFKDQKLKKHIIDIRTKNYHNAFSIIVTLERFGQIQTDLSELLEIYDNDEMPWSVCIDDLETFLLALVKMKRKNSDLVSFLKIRETVHGNLITQDELDICGGFINGKIDKRAKISA